VHANTYRNLYLSSSKEDVNAYSSIFLFESNHQSSTFFDVEHHLQFFDMIDAVISESLDRIEKLSLITNLKLCRDEKTTMIYAINEKNVNVIRKLRHAKTQLDLDLIHVVRSDKANMIHLLLKLNAFKEIKDVFNVTSLLITAESSHAYVVRELLNSRADVDAKNDED
jgi:hypothetical protein